ncbi:MAG: TadE/TadG family type IV pilus assembly protein [Lentisphaeria bacterium]|nr:TadE/TadG family type IV pilus assembly protein [Lentisphaeria bacterium]
MAVRKKTHLFSDESGSVLLETIMVIPLFVVLIGGIFWIGELMLAKHKLVNADRFAAWTAGNRHADSGSGAIKGTLQQHIFPEEQVGDQRVTDVKLQN